jgi:hypothetical protein
MSNTRSNLLAKARSKFTSKIVEFEGERIEVRSPSLGQANEFAEAAAKNSNVAMSTLMVLRCCFDPATGGPMFTPEDEAALLELPARGTFMEPVLQAVTELINDAQAAAKK